MATEASFFSSEEDNPQMTEDETSVKPPRPGSAAWKKGQHDKRSGAAVVNAGGGGHATKRHSAPLGDDEASDAETTISRASILSKQLLTAAHMYRAESGVPTPSSSADGFW